MITLPGSAGVWARMRNRDSPWSWPWATLLVGAGSWDGQGVLVDQCHGGRRLGAQAAGGEGLPLPVEGQAELAGRAFYGFLLGAVPPCPRGCVLAREPAEHVQVFAQSGQVVVHQPAHALERIDLGLAQVARDHRRLGGAPGQRVKRRDT
jgi:hypothetical protein